MPTTSPQPAATTARPLTVLIADDELLARRGVRAVIEHRGGCRVVGEASSGTEVRASILTKRPDLVLLDVQMPGGTGLDAIRSLPPDERPITVFITAYENHAVEAFGVRAADYVLKPFTDARLLEAIERARESRDFHHRAAGPPVAGRAAEQIVVRSIGRTDLVRIRELMWVEALGYYARLHTKRGTLLHRESLDSLETRLDAETFVRVHRSTMVRVSAIDEVRRTPNGGRVLWLVGGARVAVSRQGWGRLRLRLDGSRAESAPKL